MAATNAGTTCSAADALQCRRCVERRMKLSTLRQGVDAKVARNIQPRMNADEAVPNDL
jgi:hypothetical protein